MTVGDTGGEYRLAAGEEVTAHRSGDTGRWRAVLNFLSKRPQLPDLDTED